MPTELALQTTQSLLAVIAALTIPVLLMGTTLVLARREVRETKRHR